MIDFVRKSFSDGAALISSKGDSGMRDVMIDPFSKNQTRFSDFARVSSNTPGNTMGNSWFVTASPAWFCPSRGRRSSRLHSAITSDEIGNKARIFGVIVAWVSTEPGMDLRSIGEFPRAGRRRTRELVRIDRNEPDLSLFQPPADYEVVIEQMHEIACSMTAGVPK